MFGEGGLEIPVKLIAEIDASEIKEGIMKRLKQPITENYREPASMPMANLKTVLRKCYRNQFSKPESDDVE